MKKLQPLMRRHHRADFDCGNEELNRYFREYVSQDVRRRQCICNVLTEDDEIIGFYTLAVSALDSVIVPQLAVGRRPMVPTFLLGKLAVDKKYKGQGFGIELVMDAVRHCLESSIQAPCIVVDLKSADLMPFYQKAGFVPINELKAMFVLPKARI